MAFAREILIFTDSPTLYSTADVCGSISNTSKLLLLLVDTFLVEKCGGHFNISVGGSQKNTELAVIITGVVIITVFQFKR